MYHPILNYINFKLYIYIYIYIYTEMNVATFWKERTSFVRLIPKANALINSGDVNSQIGKDQNKFCLHDSPN